MLRTIISVWHIDSFETGFISFEMNLSKTQLFCCNVFDQMIQLSEITEKILIAAVELVCTKSRDVHQWT